MPTTQTSTAETPIAETPTTEISGATASGRPAAGGRAERIRRLLSDALAPETLTVRDESHRHVGHGGWREGGETHYEVIVVSKAFESLGRVERHRRINALLAPEFTAGLHALALTALTPEEAGKRAP
ncbi:MAG: BolA family protein [Pseudochelatococcus sp.]|uniref:BolA family protein n=1 Tax=Pseudochelatococcus sp. TaxID=2020869 RepID=UPI003D8A5E51